MEEAIAAAQARVGEANWHLLPSHERTKLIYEEMRRLDLERAAPPPPPGPVTS